MPKLQKIYIIHGWAYSVEPWDQTLEFLKERGYNPVMLNVPGLTAPSSDTWTIDMYVEWLHEKIGPEKNAVIVGHSNGGRIALNYDIKHPGKIKHLVLVSTAGPIRFSVRTKRRILNILNKVFSPFKKVPYMRKIVRKLTGAHDHAAAPTNMQITLDNVLTSDAKLNIRKTTARLSLIWGDKDTTTPLWMARKIIDARPDIPTPIQIIKGAKHAPYKTHAKKLADLIHESMQANGMLR